MTRLVVLYGFAGERMELEVDPWDSLRQIAACLHAQKGLGRYTYIDFVDKNAQVLNDFSSIRGLGLQEGESITATVTTEWHWEFLEGAGQFDHPCACGEPWCDDQRLVGPRLHLNFNAREPIARPGTQNYGDKIVNEMEERDPDCWVKLWRMDHAEEPESEADIALIRPRHEHVSRFKENLGDSIVWHCIDCHKVAWVVCHECRPDSSIDRPWQLGARKSKHTRCYDCYDKSLADKHDATFKKKQRDIVIEGRRLRREHELERRRRLQLMH